MLQRFFDLRFRLLALVVVALLPAAALYVYTATEDRAQGRTRAQADALDEARQIGRGQEYLVDGARGMLVTLDELLPRTLPPVPACRAPFAALLRNAPYLNAGIVGEDGTLVCSAVAPPHLAMNFSDRPWFKNALSATAGFVVDRYRVDVITGKQALVLSAPRHDERGEIAGVLFIALDIAALQRQMEAADLPAKSAIIVVDGTGTIIARRPWSGLVGKTAPESEVVRAAVNGKERSLDVTGLDGIRRIYGFANLYAGGEARAIYIAVGIPMEVAYAASNRGLVRNITALVVVAGLAIVLAWTMGAMSIARPIRTLLRATHRIAEGDLDVRVGAYPRGEMGQLAHAFDDMASALATRTAALHRAAEELEATVEQRTGELRRANAELARSNSDLEQFAYVASHDLQEPLRMVTSYLELIERRYADKLDERGHRFIGYAVDGAARMRALITDLLAYSRVGRRDTTVEAVDTARCLRDALANLEVAIRETGTVVTSDDLPTVRGNRQQLTHLFQNLVANAIKFRRDESPSIHVSVRHDGAVWTFGVRDNGIGIDPEYHDRIFTIFQRLHTRAEYPGTGIGLAICRKVVERHGGQIGVESEPGKGSLFTFTLPTTGEIAA